MYEEIKDLVDETELLYETTLHDLSLFSYHYIDYEMYENNSLMRDIRGIIFNNKSGELVARPMPKIFNYYHSLAKVNPNETVVAVDKIDGAMATGFTHKGETRFASKGHLESWVVPRAQKASTNSHKELIQYLSNNGFTPNFELLDPENPTVLIPEKLSLTLLTIRNNDTGEMLNPFRVKKIGEEFGVNTVDIISSDLTVNELVEKYKDKKDVEGVVVYGENGLGKIKTDWYNKVHPVVTDFKTKSVKILTLEQDIDDVYGLLQDEERINQVKSIEKETKNQLEKLTRKLRETVENCDSRKDLALTLKDKGEYGTRGPYFKVMDGKSPIEAARDHLLNNL